MGNVEEGTEGSEQLAEKSSGTDALTNLFLPSE